jgi:hypothetical protein
MKNVILFYLILWAILMLLLSSCTSTNNTCASFGMTTEFVDVYAKRTSDDKLEVIKFRCTPKPRLK